MAVKRAGLLALRWFVWLLLAFVLVRGIFTFIPTTAASPPNGPPGAALAEPAGVRTFPAQFVREYLTWSPTESAEAYAERLRPFLIKDLAPGRQGGRSTVGQRAETLWLYQVKQVSATRWLVTVAAELSRYELPAEGDPQPLPSTTLYIAVPIGTTPTGGWVVYDYPTLLPPPAGGEFAEPLHYGQEVTDEGDQVKELLSRFFRAYLGGSDTDLTYYLTPESKVRAVQNPWSFESVPNVVLSKTDTALYALADVVMSDPVTGARYTNRYTVSLVEQEGRRYISEILQKGE